MDLKRYQRLKDDCEELQREASRAEGGLEQTMARLKDEHGCDDLKSAKALAAKLRKDAEKAEAEYNKALTEFDRKWGNVLEDE
jgi:hypothetical protein